MKYRKCVSVLVSAIALLAVIQSAYAVGVSNIWKGGGTTTSWGDDTNWTDITSPPDGIGDIAVCDPGAAEGSQNGTATFNNNITPAKTISVEYVPAAISVMEFNFIASTSNSWTVNDVDLGGFSSTLTLDSYAVNSWTTIVDPYIYVGKRTTGSAKTVMNIALAGTKGMNKTGPGRLDLTRQNLYTGATTITAGSLYLVGGNDRLNPNAGLNVIGATGTAAIIGTLDLGGNSQTVAATQILENSNSANVIGGGIIFNGGTVQNGTLITTGANFDARSGTVSANLQGTGFGLVKTTSGLLTLSGTNSYNGGTSIGGLTSGGLPTDGGVIIFSSTSAIPTTPAAGITANVRGAIAATGAYSNVMNWLGSGKINTSSQGAIALSADSSENVNMASAGYATLSLGAYDGNRNDTVTPNYTYTGTLTPAGATYYVGGGGGSLTLSNTNAMTGNTSVVVGNGGGGTVILTAPNNYTGTTSITQGMLSISNFNQIGGASNYFLNFNGGNLRITGTTITSLSSTQVNWSTFDGGIDVADPANTVTIGDSFSTSGSFSKSGSGSMNINCNSITATQWINMEGAAVNIKNGATMSCGFGYNIANSGTSGITNLGTVGGSGATLEWTAGNETDWTGVTRIGGGPGSSATVNAYGNSEIVGRSTAGVRMVSFGEWGDGASAIANLYDHSAINIEGTLSTNSNINLGGWASTNPHGNSGTINMYDHSSLDSPRIDIGHANDGTVNMIGSNTKVTADELNVYLYGGVGTLNAGNGAVINAGKVNVEVDGYWWGGNNEGIINLTGTAQMNVTTDVTHFQGEARESTSTGNSGNVYIGVGGNGGLGGHLNISDNAQVSIENMLSLGGKENAKGYVSITCSPGQTASLSAGSIVIGGSEGGGYGGVARMDISGNATVTATGALTMGVNGGIAGDVYVSGNGTLTAGSINIGTGGGTNGLNISGNSNVSTTTSTGGTGNLTVGPNWGQVLMDPAANPLAIAGKIQLDGGAIRCTGVSNTAQAGGVQLTGSNIYFNGGTLFATAASSDFINIAGGVYIQTGAANIETYSNVTIAQAILTDPALGGGPDGGLTKNGNGRLTLSGNNTFIGGARSNNGVLQFATLGSIPTVGGIVANNNGVVAFVSSSAVPPAASITLNTGGALEVRSVDPYTTVMGWLGSGKIVTTSTGAIALSADSSENINMNGTGYNLPLGSTVYGNGANYTGTLSSVSNVYSLGGGGGTINLPNTNALTGATKSLSVYGPGLVMLSGSNNYGGGTTLISGTLIYANDASIGGASSTITFNGGILRTPLGTTSFGSHVVNWTTFTGGFDVQSTDTLTINDNITSSGSLSKTGGGTLVLGGANNYGGGTTVNGGVLRFSSLGAVPASPAAGSITINSNGALAATGAYADPQAWITSKKIATASSGAIALTADSSAAIDMGTYAALSLGAIGDVTYTGALTPAGNIYRLGGGGGTLRLTNAGALVDATTPVAARRLVVDHGSTVVLSGANTYTGGTTVNSGILSISSLANIGGSSTALNISGGLLQVTNTTNIPNLDGVTLNTTTINGGIDVGDPGTLTVNQALSGSGSFAKAGEGTLSLTGALAYTGDTSVWAGTLEAGQLTNSANIYINPYCTLYAEKIVTGNLNIGANGKLVIAPRSSFPLGGNIKSVPEPSTWVLLSIAALGLMGVIRRRNK